MNRRAKISVRDVVFQQWGCWKRLFVHVSPMVGVLVLLSFLAFEVSVRTNASLLANEGFQLTKADMILTSVSNEQLMGIIASICVAGIVLLGESIMTRPQFILAYQSRRRFLISQMTSAIGVGLIVGLSLFLIVVLISVSHARFGINFLNKGSYFTAMTGVTQDVSMYMVMGIACVKITYLTCVISLMYVSLRWITNSPAVAAVLVLVFYALVGSGKVPGLWLSPDLYYALYVGIIPCNWLLIGVCVCLIAIAFLRINYIDFLNSNKD